MSDAPLTVAFGYEHGKPRWNRRWLTIFHSRELVKAGDNDSIITNYDIVSFLDRVLVTAAL